jgi:hypothetical protein
MGRALATYLMVGFMVACLAAASHREHCGSPIGPSLFVGVIFLWGPILPVTIAESAIYGDSNYACDP